MFAYFTDIRPLYEASLSQLPYIRVGIRREKFYRKTVTTNFHSLGNTMRNTLDRVGPCYCNSDILSMRFLQTIPKRELRAVLLESQVVGA